MLVSRSEGAKHCPDKIASTKELGKKAAEIYWACRTEETMPLLAEVKQLAKEAESCRPPARVTPPPPPQPISFHPVYFDFDKSNLKPEGKAELNRPVRIMQDNADVAPELQSNTDSVGTYTYNKALGDRRAKSVFDYLKSKGVNPNRLKEMSFGECKPVATNATDASRAQNRRVDLVLLK